MFKTNNENDRPLSISFSQYSRYKYCPWKYFIEKVANVGLDDKNINLYFGSAFHSVLQKKFVDYAMPLETIKNHFKITLFYLMHKDNFECPKEEYEIYLQQAYSIFDALPFDKIIEEYEIIETEYDFFYEISPKKTFHGIIDFILKNKLTGRYLIGDWKTSLHGWNDYKIKDDLLITQLQFYKFFWSKKKNISSDLIDTEYWVVTREEGEKFTRIPINFKDQEIKLNIGDLKNSMKLIYTDNKFPKVKFRNSNRCKWCVYDGKPEYCNEDMNQKLEITKTNEQQVLNLDAIKDITDLL